MSLPFPLSPQRPLQGCGLNPWPRFLQAAVPRPTEPLSQHPGISFFSWQASAIVISTFAGVWMWLLCSSAGCVFVCRRLSSQRDAFVSRLVLPASRFKLLLYSPPSRNWDPSTSFNSMLVVLYPEVKRRAPKKLLSVKQLLFRCFISTAAGYFNQQYVLFAPLGRLSQDCSSDKQNNI